MMQFKKETHKKAEKTNFKYTPEIYTVHAM